MNQTTNPEEIHSNYTVDSDSDKGCNICHNAMLREEQHFLDEQDVVAPVHARSSGPDQDTVRQEHTTSSTSGSEADNPWAELDSSPWPSLSTDLISRLCEYANVPVTPRRDVPVTPRRMPPLADPNLEHCEILRRHPNIRHDASNLSHNQFSEKYSEIYDNQTSSESHSDSDPESENNVIYTSNFDRSRR